MKAHNMALVSALNIPGGGQIIVDGTTAYIGHTKGPEATTIIDVADPANPIEVGRWHAPGQWVAGEETPTWDGTATRCHHPIRKGDRDDRLGFRWHQAHSQRGT